MLFILLFIFILNVVAIVLTYKFLPDMEKRDRMDICWSWNCNYIYANISCLLD